MLHSTVEVEHALRRPTSAINKSVTSESGFHEMLADRYSYLVVTTRVGLDYLTVAVLHHTIHVHLYAFNGDVGTGIIDMSAHHKR